MDVVASAKAFNQRAISQNWQQVCDPTLDFSDPYYTKLLAIWREKAGTHPIPMRSQMTARDLKDYLRHIIILQRDDHDNAQYRWRLIGTSVTEIVGHNTGKLLKDSIAPEHLERWTEAFDLILESEQPWRFLGRVKLHGREYLNAEHLYLPLADDNNKPNFVMGLCRYAPRLQDNDAFSEDEIFSLPGALL